MQRVLLAVDGSQRCIDAVFSLGQILKSRRDCTILLYHCVQKLGVDYLSDLVATIHTYHVPPELQMKAGEAVLESARQSLLESGFPEADIRVKLKLFSDDPAQDILAEARDQGIGIIALGRRGLGRMESLLIGSVSSKVAQYSGDLSVWIVDTPLHKSQKALVAIQGVPGGTVLLKYVSEVITPLPYSQYTLLHILPSVTPTYTDAGNKLKIDQQLSEIEKRRASSFHELNTLMSNARDSLIKEGLAAEDIMMRIEPAKVGIARDLLDEISREKYQMVVIGKKSLQKKTPFLLGSLANKLLHNARGVILCMVGAEPPL